MHRFYADESGVVNGLAHLPQEDAVHAARVLRMKPGEACELFAGDVRFAAVVETIAADDVTLRVTGELPSTEARLRITLYQGLPKAEKMELIVQKAVELGADAVVPVAMSRCVVKLDPKDARKKQERWQKIAREACKQSGRCKQMDVAMPISMKQLLERLPQHQYALVPWEDARTISLNAIHAAHPEATDIAIVIGPEGGMSADEVAAMEQQGCTPVTLGPRILRTETAGLAAIAALLCLYGDMM